MPQNNPGRDTQNQTGGPPTSGAGGPGGGRSGATGGGAGGKDLPSVSTATSATAGNEDIGAQLDTLRSDLSQLSSTVTQLLQSQGSGLRDAAMGAVGMARDRVGATVSGAAEQGRYLADQAQTQIAAMAREVEAQIERNPMTAVFVALGVGFAIGLMSRGR